MKKNKLLIYIALFFCLFMSGVTKVKAADYLICKYTINKSANKNFKQNLEIYGYFYNGKLAHWGSNQPTTTSTKLKEDAGAEYIEFLNDGANDACPTLKISKYDCKGACGFKKINDEIPLTAKKDVYYYQNLVDKSCKYTDNNNVTRNIKLYYTTKNFFNNGNTFPVFLVTGDSEKDINVDYFIDGKDGKESWLEKVNHYFKYLDGGCPENFYLNSSSRFVMSNQTINLAESSSGKKEECKYKNDKSYKNTKSWVEKTYSNGKVNITVNSNLADEIVTNYEIWESFIQNNNLDNVENDDYSICDIDGISKKFYAIVEKCNDNDSCKNEKTTGILENLTEVLKNLNSLNSLEYQGFGKDETIDCNGIFGDVNDETSLMYIIKQVFTWIQIAVPILLIILGISDFSKVVVSQDADAIKKATSKFSKRCVVAIIIFFLPYIIMMILGWFDDYIISIEPDCVIGNLNIIVENIKYLIR